MKSMPNSEVSENDSSSADKSISQFQKLNEHVLPTHSTNTSPHNSVGNAGNNDVGNFGSASTSTSPSGVIDGLVPPLAPLSKTLVAESANPAGAQISLAKRSALFEGTKGDASNWNDQDVVRKRKTHPVVQGIIYFLVGLGSFLIFVYLTFPYGVIKEVAVSALTENFRKTGLPVRVAIGGLKPHWLTGVKLKDVTITNVTNQHAVITFTNVTARLNMLPLLLGKISIGASVSQSSGTLDVAAELPLFSAIRGLLASPSSANIELKNFSLDPFINHALAYARASKDPGMVLVLPLLAQTTGGGAVSGELSMENPDASHFGKAKGKIQLQLAKGFFHIDDTTLKIPRQNFNDVRIDLGFANNSIEFKNLQLKAEDIGVGITGKVALADLPGSVAQADLNFELSMHGEIEKNLGFIVPNMMRCKPLVQGELKAKLTGPVSQMACE